VLADEALPWYPPPFWFDFFWPRSPAYDPANPSGCWPLLAPPPASPGALAYRCGFPTSLTTSNLLLYAALQLHACPAATLAVVMSLACSAPLRLRLLHHDDDLAYNLRPFSTSTPSVNPSRWGSGLLARLLDASDLWVNYLNPDAHGTAVLALLGKCL
jgi:hypothetical protein